MNMDMDCDLYKKKCSFNAFKFSAPEKKRVFKSETLKEFALN